MAVSQFFLLSNAYRFHVFYFRLNWIISESRDIRGIFAPWRGKRSWTSEVSCYMALGLKCVVMGVFLTYWSIGAFLMCSLPSPVFVTPILPSLGERHWATGRRRTRPPIFSLRWLAHPCVCARVFFFCRRHRLREGGWRFGGRWRRPSRAAGQHHEQDHTR